MYEAYRAPVEEPEHTFLAIVPTIENAITPLQVEIPEPPKEVVISSPFDAKEFIKITANKYGFPEHLALKVAKCESGFDPNAKNPKSTAEGIYQFIDSTWAKTLRDMGLPKTTSKYDPKANIEAGIWLMKHEGTQHWQESKNCWSKKL